MLYLYRMYGGVTSPLKGKENVEKYEVGVGRWYRGSDRRIVARMCDVRVGADTIGAGGGIGEGRHTVAGYGGRCRRLLDGGGKGLREGERRGEILSRCSSSRGGSKQESGQRGRRCDEEQLAEAACR